MVTKRSKNVIKQITSHNIGNGQTKDESGALSNGQKTLQQRAGRNLNDSQDGGIRTEELPNDSCLKKRGSSMKPPRNKTPTKGNPFSRPGRESMQVMHQRSPSEGQESSLPQVSQA